MLTREYEHALEQVPQVDETGTRVARAIHDAVLHGGERARDVADVLHGTWLGHPLHPVLTDATIGSWTAGAIFDVVGAVSGSETARNAGDALAALGTATAVPTAITGLADYSTVPQDAAGTATLHGLINSVGLGLFALSLRDRRSGRRSRGLFFSSLAFGMATVSAWLGGQLVYGHRVGVDHSDSFSGPEDWTPVLPEAELPDGESRAVEIDGDRVLLCRADGRVHAIGAVCSHAGGPLEDGSFDGCFVECPWHDSVFDVRDGSIAHGPATHPQPDFDARVRDGQIELRLRNG